MPRQNLLIKYFSPQTELSDFFRRDMSEILMEGGSQKTSAYRWICQGILQALDLQEIGADQDKNRSTKS